MAPAQPFFFPNAGRRLLGVLHAPHTSANGRGLVLCNGFAGEFIVFRSHLNAFARRLAERGYSVLRFDYGGYGDSEGAFSDADVASMQADVHAALEELKRRAEVTELGLVGIRFGATLAALAAAERADIGRLVLWEPVLNPWEYIYGELRQTVAMQTVLFREIHFTRDAIVENTLAGRPSLADGYNFNCIDEGFPLGRSLIEQSRMIDLLAQPPAVTAPTLLLHVRKRPGSVPPKLDKFAEALRAQRIDCAVDVAVEPSLPWKHEAFYATHSPEVCAKTLAWLEH